MRVIVIAFLLFNLFSCKQKQDNDSNEIEITKLKPLKNIKTYIHNVNQRDSLCILDIEHAKTQIDSGKLVFTLQMGFGSYNTRQAKQLQKLCKKYGLYFDYDEISDSFTNEYQTPGCYGAYMDEAIENKFGKNFRKKILREADNLIIACNDTVNAYECDVRPEIYDLEEDNVIYLSRKYLNNVRDSDGQLGRLDVVIYIDKNGKPIGYNLYEYMPDSLNLERKKLFNYISKELQNVIKSKKCKPGEIIGQKVITENFVTVKFN